jgi:tRNA(fMet)-specific endonuclease VapC
LKYLLDTNACIVHLRSGGTSRVSQRITAAAVGDIAICSPVREELLFGALMSARAQQNRSDVESFVAGLPSLPFDDHVADACAAIRADLEKWGLRIGFNDCLIAATALANALILVTHNVSELSRVHGLTIEDWESMP